MYTKGTWFIHFNKNIWPVNVQNCTYPRPYYFEDHCVSFALLQGILVSKVLVSGPLKYSGNFPLSVDKVIFFHLSFAVRQGMLINQGCLLLDCQYVLYVVCMYMCFLLLCALEKDPTHSLLLLEGSGKFTCTVAKHLYQKPYTLFLCFKAERGFPTVPFIWTSVYINAVVHPYLWSRILHPCTPLTSEAHKLFFEHFSLKYIHMYAYTYGPV